jgi:SAM-dependent methyltransferase
MNRGHISNLLRKANLILFADRLNFTIQKLRNRKTNREFRKQNPGVVLPSDYLIYECFQINYRKFFSDSIRSAEWLAGLFGKYTAAEGKKILDWGCGPGRIIRYLPLFLPKDCELTGTDYNKRSIEWCKENLPGIIFNQNSTDPPLPFRDDYFDIIYGLSVFTHLSEELHYEWFNELFRLLKPGGIIVFTTQGDNFRVKLTGKELEKFNRGELVTRGNSIIGHRTFSAFHPAGFIKKLFCKMELLDHIENESGKTKVPPQDVWVFRKYI